MDGSDRWIWRAVSLVAGVALVLGMGSAAAEASDSAVASTRLRHPEDRVAVVQAIRGAARRLGDPRCQALLTNFTDAEGRSLREALDAEGLTAAEHLGRLFFYDGAASRCGARHLAYTDRGSRVVFVCGHRFRTLSQQNPPYVEAAIIHEALHSLGL